MTILIKGMEMPKNCFLCPLSVLNGERLYCEVTRQEVLRAKIDSDCPLTKLPTIEELMEPMCDQCQWPGWYKDPDDLQREKCSVCPVEAKLAEALYGE